MDRNTINRFGGKFVHVSEDTQMVNYGFLKAIIGGNIVLSNRWDYKGEKLVGEKALGFAQIRTIEEVRRGER